MILGIRLSVDNVLISTNNVYIFCRPGRISILMQYVLMWPGLLAHEYV